MHQRTFSITNPSFMDLGIPRILLWQTYIVKHTQCWSLDIKQKLKLLISPARHIIMRANKIQNRFSHPTPFKMQTVCRHHSWKQPESQHPGHLLARR